MNISEKVLRNDEKAIYTLRDLYRNHGYSHYKISKFEEYDLYAHHKNFLVSDSILSFTDKNGKLMALKPDVTLSIAKHVSDDSSNVTQKVYYNEHVYRTSASSDGFREIMQTGLECIGNVDIYAESEVIMLAMKSLQSISEDYLLDLSHMGLLEGMLEAAGIDISYHSLVLNLIGSKNIPGIRTTCANLSIDEDMCQRICEMVSLYLPMTEATEVLSSLIVGEKAAKALKELRQISEILDIYGLSKHLFFDFSIVSDTHYYDGLIFKGFLNGLSESLLSGGRYDRLLTQLGKKQGMGAIGFAVYLDRLEHFGSAEESFDIDVLLIYEDNIDIRSIVQAVRLLNESGKTVRTATAPDPSVRCRQLLKIGKGGIEILETYD